MRASVERGLDRAARFADRHERAITVAGAIWLAVTCASYVFRIPWPEIPFLTDDTAWMVSGGWNAVWWGFLHPAIEKRREKNGQTNERLPES